jgi:hypothetical protein
MSQKESNEAANKLAAQATELHKPPSMLWFVIPLGLIIVYALLSR